MFPMVGGVDDFRRAKDFVLGVMDELDAEHIPFNRDIKLGVMIEIPSAALMADALAAEADFGSIGTNDLCQYTLAADRMNERTAPYYRSCDPAVLRLIRYAAQEFSKAGKPLGVCGRSRHKDAEHGSRKHARGKGNARLAQLRRRKGARRRRVRRRLRRGGPVHP